MPRVYFLSYARPGSARQQTADQVDRFERDLSEVLGNKMAGDGLRMSFRDSCSIEAGTARWSDELAQQLVAYPIGLVLLSPQYLERERTWCRWEYQFLARRNDVVAQLPTDIARVKPRLLLVLDWIRTEARDLPENLAAESQRVSESIVRNGNAQDMAAVRFVLERGLWDVIKMAEVNDVDALPAYQRFMLCLGAYLVEQWARWLTVQSALEQHAVALPLPPAFNVDDTWLSARPTNAAAPACVRATRAQRRKIFVVYVAARPHEVPRTRVHRYNDDGEYDWKPFAGPIEDENEPHVCELLRCLDGVEIREWGFDDFRDHMEDRMSLAGRRYPVLFIVDPWTTTQLHRYHAVLEQYVTSRLDETAFSAPIVVWNDNDPDAATVRRDFEDRVTAVFGRNRWEPSASRDEFQETLTGTVRALQRRIRNAAADELPPGGGSALLRICATT